jgi:hypothetical protein
MRILLADAFGAGRFGFLPIRFPGLGRHGKMKATLDGAQQNPPVTTEGKGAADLGFDIATKQLSWSVTYSGLSGPARAGHIFTDRWRRVKMPASSFRSWALRKARSRVRQC